MVILFGHRSVRMYKMRFSPLRRKNLGPFIAVVQLPMRLAPIRGVLHMDGVQLFLEVENYYISRIIAGKLRPGSYNHG